MKRFIYAALATAFDAGLLIAASAFAEKYFPVLAANYICYLLNLQRYAPEKE